MNLEFPRIEHDKKKSVKLTIKEIQEVKLFYLQGLSISKLAEMYNVSNYCVRYWVLDDWREKEKQRLLEKELRRQQDPANREHRRKIDNEYHKRNRERIEVKKWDSNDSVKWKKNNYEKAKKHWTKQNHKRQLIKNWNNFLNLTKDIKS